MNMIDSIKSYMLSKTTPYADIAYNVFSVDDSESICLRFEPSNESIYLDGTKFGEQNFSLNTRSTDQEKALNQLNTFKDVLDLENMTEITDGVSVIIKNTSMPVLTGLTESREYIFSASFAVEYWLNK